jgi:hypothetical protein
MERPVIKALFCITIATLLSCAGCNLSQRPSTSAEEQAPPPPEPSRVTDAPVPNVPASASLSSTVAPAPGPIGLTTVSSAWHIFSTKNHPGEDDLISTLSDTRNFNLIVRQHGSKLECYISSGDAPDEMDLASKRRSPLKYRFDDGPQVKEQWRISVHGTSLMYPGDALEFIETIRKSRRLEMEVSRSGDTADIEVFNLALFPEGIIGALAKTQ